MTISNSTFWGLLTGLDENAVEVDAADDDGAFIDGSIFTDDASNVLYPDPAPFSAEECLEIEGPASAVLDSEGISPALHGDEPAPAKAFPQPRSARASSC